MAFTGLGYTGSGAVPVDCTEAGRLIQMDTSLHSVLWNVTAGTSSVRGSLNTGKRPVRTKHHNTRVTKGGALVIESQEWFYKRPPVRNTKGGKIYTTHSNWPKLTMAGDRLQVVEAVLS